MRGFSSARLADSDSPKSHDSIMAAGRYLAANGFADDHDHAIFRYNNLSRAQWTALARHPTQSR